MSFEALFDRVVASLVEADVAVERARIMHSEGLRANGRFFAFARRGELVVKLPADRVAALVAGGVGEPFVTGRRTMREWVTLRPADETTCASYVDEARAFAS